MGKRDKKSLKMHVETTKRERRMSILMSDDEQMIVDRYLDKYKITNKSRWLRETILIYHTFISVCISSFPHFLNNPAVNFITY